MTMSYTLYGWEVSYYTGKVRSYLERFLGGASYPYAGDTHARLAVPFTLWLIQRTLDVLAAMPVADAERTRQWVKDSGGASLLDLDIPRLEISLLTVKFE